MGGTLIGLGGVVMGILRLRCEMKGREGVRGFVDIT